MPLVPRRLLALAVLALAACGNGSKDAPADPFTSPPPLGAAIARTEGAPIAGATGWTWIPFPDSLCTDATGGAPNAYQFSTSPTGLAISWGAEASTDVVVFLQGGGACWDFVTCGGAATLGVAKAASTGPFGPEQFAADIYAKYPSSWVRRANL